MKKLPNVSFLRKTLSPKALFLRRFPDFLLSHSFLFCLEVLVLLCATNREFDSFLCSMCWPYVLTCTSLFSTTKDGSKEDGVCSFRNRF